MADALVVLADVKSEMSITSTDEDALLQILLDAALSIWDELTGRKWLSTALTEYYDVEKYSKAVFLDNYPVTVMTSVFDDPDWVYGNDTLLATADYKVNMDRGVIHYNGYFSGGAQSVKVVYTAGYTSTTVPKWLKEMICRQVANWHQQAKNKRWAVSSVSSKEGTSLNFQLKENLLPDFVLLAERNDRKYRGV